MGLVLERLRRGRGARLRAASSPRHARARSAPTSRSSPPTWAASEEANASRSAVLRVESLDAGVSRRPRSSTCTSMPRRGRRPARPQRRRQDDDALDDRRPAAALLGGAVWLDGEDVDGVPAHKLARRGVSLVPEGRCAVLRHDRRPSTCARPRRGQPPPRRADRVLPELEQVPRPQGRACSPAASSRCSRSAARWCPRRACCWSTR